MNAIIESVQLFIDTGGPILWGILLLSVVLWSLITERFIFFKMTYPLQAKHWIGDWNERSDKSSRRAHRIRESIISRAKSKLISPLPIIKSLVALCPLLGLLGTVTGMIHVFDVMSVLGTGNVRAMALGVSRATIPTMAGMVLAIPGLYFTRLMASHAEEEIRHLADLLRFD